MESTSAAVSPFVVESWIVNEMLLELVGRPVNVRRTWGYVLKKWVRRKNHRHGQIFVINTGGFPHIDGCDS